MAQEVQDAAGNGSKAAVAFASAKPWLVVEAPKAIDAVQFYKEAFGAEELHRALHPVIRPYLDLPIVIWAEIKIGSMNFVVSDLTGDISDSMKSFGTVLCLETEDLEAAVAKAVVAGAVPDGEISDGEGAWGGVRVGKVKDPYGNVWVICTPHVKCEDVEPEEPEEPEEPVEPEEPEEPVEP